MKDPVVIHDLIIIVSRLLLAHPDITRLSYFLNYYLCSYQQFPLINWMEQLSFWFWPFIFVTILLVIKGKKADEGICSVSAPSCDHDSKPLYVKVTNPTLNPSCLQGTSTIFIFEPIWSKIRKGARVCIAVWCITW